MGSARQIVTRTVCAAVLCGLLGGEAPVVLASGTAGTDPEYPAVPVPPPPPAAQPQVIEGGQPSRAWSAQTSVLFRVGSESYRCGGTLVSARWVLTAGHGASSPRGALVSPRAYALRVGSTRRTRGGRTPAVDRVVRHPFYDNDSLRNDFALLHLATAVRQQPLRMIGTSRSERALWSPGRDARIIGWGASQNRPASARLMEGRTQIVSDALCWSTWQRAFQATSMLCAGGAGSDACEGDSGGPLMVPRGGAFVLVGVTSWGGACRRDALPGVYARLGAGAINAWAKRSVPTVSLTAASAAKRVTLKATVGPSPGRPRLVWDLDADGAYDDATGLTASAIFTVAGRHVVKVQSRYSDGDRAIARTTVSVRGT